MISILMATYNGGQYVAEQIESIISQTYTDWTLYIRDDGSTDSTPNVIKCYAEKYPRKVIILEDSTKHRGANYSFIWMLSQVDSDYYMFCDQDDVWMPDKIELTFLKLKEEESKVSNVPILVHTDMIVVDQNLNHLSESAYDSMKIKSNLVDNSFNFMGVCTCGPGCTMMFNKRAKECSLNYDNLNNLPMHDWWIAINTVKDGKVCFIKESTMLYRQHKDNTVGVQNMGVVRLVYKAIHLRKTISPYYEDMVWLKKVGYGGISKYLFYKFIYNLIRVL